MIKLNETIVINKKSIVMIKTTDRYAINFNGIVAGTCTSLAGIRYNMNRAVTILNKKQSGSDYMRELAQLSCTASKLAVMIDPTFKKEK